MLRSLTHDQFLGWLDYAELEPFGELRDDYRMANIMQLLANINRDTKTRPQPFTISDFLFQFEKEEDKPGDAPKWQRMLDTARTWAAVYNEPGR